MGRRERKYSKAARVADAVGVGTLLLGTTLIFLGEITDLFTSFSVDHGGVVFVFRYLCAPVYWLLAPVVKESHDLASVLMSGMMVVVAAAVVYGLLTYAVIRIGMSVLGIKG